MEINHFANSCIFTPLTPILDDRASRRLICDIKTEEKMFDVDC